MNFCYFCRDFDDLFVDPRFGGGSVVHQFFWLEPQSDCLFGGVDGITTVADVPANIDTEITSDATWSRSKWVGGAQHGSALFDGVFTFPDHAADWTGVHVFDQTGEEWFA